MNNRIAVLVGAVLALAGVLLFHVSSAAASLSTQSLLMTPSSDLGAATPASPDLTIGSTITFPIGPGWVDVIPHQLVRTASDQLYIFGVKGDTSSTLVAYWTVSGGLPFRGSDFSGSLTLDNGAEILSTAVAYDGAGFIHVLTNDLQGRLIDRPFDLSVNQFKTAHVLDTGGGVVSGNYVGTGGIAGMWDLASTLHVAYWTSGGHILYRAYTYDAAKDTLTLTSGPTQLDAAGGANHPSLAVSPLDGSVSVAWVSQAASSAQILARTRSAGSWGAIQTLSTAPVWTSTSSGINIDQGPSLIIGADGVRRLAYIENWRVTVPFDYGRVHYVTGSGSSWTDTFIGAYSHDPAVAIDSSGQVYIFGHGYPLNSACTSVDDLCLFRQNSNGTWAAPTVFLAHQGTQSFDSSPSVKWSVVGFNRPDMVEFLFAQIGAGYASPVLYYGRTGPPLSLNDSTYMPCVARP